MADMEPPTSLREPPPDGATGPLGRPNGPAGPGLEVITIRGRKVVGGVAEGEALVSPDRISGWGGVDPRSGSIVETRHALRGQSFAGKVLVFPGAKGSSGWSAQFHMTRVLGTGPAAWLFNEMTTKVALGTVVSHAPAMTDFDRDPLTLIKSGDHVRVDADAGVVTITGRHR
jgi:uncharacterized protein